MMARIEVLDLGLNNVTSVCRGFEAAGADIVRVADRPADHSTCELMVLPGVGAFGAAMDRLRESGLDRVVLDHAERGGKLLGICLGMQLLTDTSDESPGITGLGLVPGVCRRLPSQVGERVPHIGWSGSSILDGDGLVPHPQSGFDYYFVHSYHVVLRDAADQIAESRFGSLSFTAAAGRENVVGFQFHPEKSSKTGLRLLRDVVEWAGA